MFENDPLRWKRILSEMLRESNATRLQTLADSLEEAIFERQQELGDTEEVIREKLGLLDATDRLYEIRTQKLGFPDWRKRAS
jgi:hypothetical protein